MINYKLNRTIFRNFSKRIKDIRMMYDLKLLTDNEYKYLLNKEYKRKLDFLTTNC